MILNFIFEDLDNFANHKDAYFLRKHTINDIKLKLPLNLEIYHTFAREYTEQDTLNLNSFWVEFQKQKVIQEKIDKNIEEKDEMFRRKQIAENLFKSSEKLEEQKATEKRKIKFIESEEDKDTNKKGKQQTPYKFGDNADETRCLQEYRKLSWLKLGTLNTGIYITSKNIDDLLPYIIENKVLDYKGEKWFAVGKQFFYFVCSPDSMFRKQTGDIMTVINYEGKKLYIKVGFKPKNKEFFIQNEEIFASEKRYYAVKQLSVKQSIVELGAENINNQILSISKQRLSSELRKIEPNIKDYGSEDKYDTEYINEAINTIEKKSTNINDFLNKLGELIIYLKNDKAQILKERIRQNYYIPSILVDLSAEEKFPEANIDQIPLYKRKIVTDSLRYDLKEYVFDTLEQYYYTKSGKRRYTKSSKSHITKDIETYPLEDRCVNYKEMINIPEYKVEYYEDPDDFLVYCLSVDNIIEQLKNNTLPVNPYTQKQLSNDFIVRFTNIYVNDRSIPTELSTKQLDTSDDKVKIQKEELAPGLLDIILTNIKNCEQELLDDDKKKCSSLENQEDEVEIEEIQDEDEDEDEDEDDTPEDDEDEEDDDTPEDEEDEVEIEGKPRR